MKTIKIISRKKSLVMLFMVVFLLFSSQANAATTSKLDYDGNSTSCTSHHKNLSVPPDTQVRFLVDGIFSHKWTEWYINGNLQETDESKVSNGYLDPEVTININVCTGSYTIKAEIYKENADTSWTWLCVYTWYVTISGDCSSGDCCDDCYYKSSSSQPTGKTDYYFCEGSNSVSGTNYVKKRDYKCTGSSSSSTYNDTTSDTCGVCWYCTNGDPGCNSYDNYTVCESNVETEYACYGTGCGDDVKKRSRDRQCTSGRCNFYVWKSWTLADNCSSSETCSNGDSSCNYTQDPCDCQSHASQQCYDGDVYYYDDCGNLEGKKEDCDFGCSGASCKDEPADCTDGLCCNVSTKKFQPDTFICNEELEEGFRCETEDCGANAQSRLKVQYCSGDSKACNGEEKWLEWETLEACDDNDACNSDEGFAECVDCPEGCGDDNTGECNKPDCTEGECCDLANGVVYGSDHKCDDSNSESDDYRCNGGEACGSTLEVKSYEYYCDGVSENCPASPRPSAWEVVETCNETTQRCSLSSEECVADSACNDEPEPDGDVNNNADGDTSNSPNDNSNDDDDDKETATVSNGCNSGVDGNTNSSSLFGLLILMFGLAIYRARRKAIC